MQNTTKPNLEAKTIRITKANLNKNFELATYNGRTQSIQNKQGTIARKSAEIQGKILVERMEINGNKGQTNFSK